MTPRAAPNRWPYRDHRTIEQIDAATPALGRPPAHRDGAGEALLDSKHMSARSADFLAALSQERRP